MKLSLERSSGAGGGSLQAHGRPAAAPSVDSRPSCSGDESVLERRYPGVVRAMLLMWGYPELTEFLDRVALGLDERLRDIEPAALAEMMLLAQVHRSFCPGRTQKSSESLPALRTLRGWQPIAQRG